ncbi:MAG TPA: helix-turn-helix transcriptional regulator [Candidatus Ornithoclostridium faecigallinarum]|nr:helix-turn-helix transcriptional regulator [Candidatus Ornithoclostridium faecigallinarum]
MSDVDKIFGANLRRLRKARHISQERFAALVGATQRSMSHYERGESQPSLECLCRIADELDVSVDELLGRGAVDPYR